MYLGTQQVFIGQVLVLVGGVASLSEDKSEALVGFGEALGCRVAHLSSTLLLLLQEFLVDGEDKVLPTLGAEIALTAGALSLELGKGLVDTLVALERRNNEDTHTKGQPSRTLLRDRTFCSYPGL